MNTLVMNRKALLVLLATVSVVLYLADFAVLGNFRDTGASFLGNLAFLPIYVIFVTMMVERVMKERERQAVMRKLKMVIGVFFSEVGNRLLRELSSYVVASDVLKGHLAVTAQWKDEQYASALHYLKHVDLKIDCAGCDKQALKDFLVGKRNFLVGLLENQNLLEHEEFTDLLWSVFHLVEELEARQGFNDMPQSDIDHINGDIKRVFGHLSREWLLYMQHLKKDYPYLFSLAVRLNPMLDHPDARVY